MYTTYDYSFELDDQWVDLELEVLDFAHVEPHKGSPHTCDSDMDYYGYTDISWDIFSYSITNNEGVEVDSGQGCPPDPFYLPKHIHDEIEEHLIEVMLEDRNTF